MLQLNDTLYSREPRTYKLIKATVVSINEVNAVLSNGVIIYNKPYNLYENFFKTIDSSLHDYMKLTDEEAKQKQKFYNSIKRIN